MSEIYMRKKAFWNEKNDHEKNRKTIYIILILLFMFIAVGIIIPNREHIFKHFIEENESLKFTNIYPLSVYSEKKKARLKCFILSNSKICENIYKKRKQKTPSIYLDSGLKFILYDSPLILRFNPLLQSTPFQEDYYLQKFNLAYRNLLFQQCLSQVTTYYDNDLKKISRDIELFYNFLLNKPKLEFEFTNDYESDINYYNNHMCFISGTAHLALKTKIIPKCIEFKNFHINNFYILNKRESTIYFKFHVFKMNINNKIHIYPSSKQMINYNLIKEYADISDYFEYKNVLIYLDHNTGDKMIRICNVLSTVDPTYYDNNFWLEIVWNPEIQNLLCVEKINYIN